MDNDDYREHEQLLAEVRAQSPLRELADFDHGTALSVGRAIAAVAEERSLPIVISVYRGEQRVFHSSFAGTTAEHDDWVRRKRNTAILHDVPSLEFVLRQRVSGRVPDWLDPHEYAVAGGAVPVVVRGNTVGVVTVSGMVDSIRSDHDLAMQGIRSVRDEAPVATR